MTSSPRKPPRKDKAIVIRVDEELHREATNLANQQGWSLSEIIRAWLRLFVKGEVSPPPDHLVERERRRAPKRNP